MVEIKSKNPELQKLYSSYQNFPLQAIDWYPTPEDMERYVIPNQRKYIPFLIWLRATNQVVKKKDKHVIELIDYIVLKHLKQIKVEKLSKTPKIKEKENNEK